MKVKKHWAPRNRRGQANDDVLITQALDPKEITDQIICELKDAINAEMGGLLKNKALKKARASTAPKDANVMGSRLVLSVKHYGTDRERKKARLVAQGHKDVKKNVIVNDSPTLMKLGMRLVVFLASAFDLILCSRDVKQAYLQSDTKFLRDAHIKMPKGWRDNLQEYLLKLLKPLHGVTEAGSCWLDAYLNFFLEDMDMEISCWIPVYFARREMGN